MFIYGRRLLFYEKVFMKLQVLKCPGYRANLEIEEDTPSVIVKIADVKSYGR